MWLKITEEAVPQGSVTLSLRATIGSVRRRQLTTVAAPTPPRLLVVEDDTSLREAIDAVLSATGYDVLALPDGCDIDQRVEAFRPDMAILDVRLPAGPDGFEIGRRMRALLGIPVVFVTAADALHDRLHGFEVGADDYLVKPFAMAELLARARAVLRRAGRLGSSSIEVRDLVLDEANRVATRGGRRVELTKIEFDLLSVLAREPGRVFSKAHLLAKVWGFAEYSPNLVEVHICALRRKLEAVGSRLVHTERGEGYVIRR
jgi:two-component system OmpR family response regulator